MISAAVKIALAALGMVVFVASIGVSMYVSPLAGSWMWLPAIGFGIPAGLGLILTVKALVALDGDL